MAGGGGEALAELHSAFADLDSKSCTLWTVGLLISSGVESARLFMPRTKKSSNSQVLDGVFHSARLLRIKENTLLNPLLVQQDIGGLALPLLSYPTDQQS